MKEFTLTVIAEDSISDRGKDLRMEVKHGLSILIRRTEPRTSILMDTGQSSDILLHNMKMIDIDLDKLDVIFLSHGHYDHTGGLLGIFHNTKRNIPIIAHPDIFKPKFKVTPHLKYIGCPYRLTQLELNTNVLFARNSIPIADGIITTGEIKRTTSYEKPKGFWMVRNKMLVEDTITDDQALIINIENKGLVVLSGCAHSGIVNTIRHAQILTGVSKVHAVIGGYHLLNSSEEIIGKTLEDLTKINPAFIYPCHCTGSKNILKLTKSFGKRCKPLKTGDVLKI